MDVTAIGDLIVNFGFAGMCVVLLWQNNNTIKNHKEEVKGLSDVIEQNTIALTKLAERIK